MNKVGFYWHVHHDVLVEWCWDYDERVAYIKAHKPIVEQKLRLRLFQPVKGELPVAFVKAGEARIKAREVSDKAREACVKARDASVKAEEAWGKAWEAHNTAGEACREDILALHDQECPGCPWDGETILPKER